MLALGQVPCIPPATHLLLQPPSRIRSLAPLHLCSSLALVNLAQQGFGP